MTYHIVINGSDCAPWAERCIRSAQSQKKPWGHGVSLSVGVDGSTDGTDRIVQGLVKADVWDENMGAAYARHRLLSNLSARPNDVVVLLDLDDHLPHENVILRVHEEYEKGADVTYGSYRFETGGSWPQQPYTNGYNGEWRCWPLRTFRYRLFDPSPDRFIMDGEWIRKGTDVALMLPMLKKAEKIVFIPETLYIYNHDHPKASRKVVTPAYKKKVMAWIR